MALFAPTFNNLNELLINELRDLYSAESQLIKALPKMAEAASDPKLKSAFEMHLKETEDQAYRLENIFSELGEKPTGETCKAMEGLVKESSDYVKAGGNPDVRDAGLIGAAQRVEHYEMAGYGTARALATRLGLSDIAQLLQTTLDEEAAADQKLTEIAEGQVNINAAQP
jgi:ferritin-like metal-binding protein YciE